METSILDAVLLQPLGTSALPVILVNCSNDDLHIKFNHILMSDAVPDHC